MEAAEKYTLIVSLNAAVDRIVEMPGLRLGEVNRSESTVEQAGGKGINVARVLTTLGHRVLVIGFTGGLTGQQIREDLLHSHIPCSLIPVAGRSRNCYILVDPITNQQTVINEPGPEITIEEYRLFQHELARRLADANLLICSGSLPRGIAPDCYQEFIEMAHKQGLQSFVDATGEALRLALAAKPFLIKPNREEAEQLLGVKIEAEHGLAAARAIFQQGVALGLVSLGASGAAAVWSDGEIFVDAPPVSAINAVACGDSFLAGCADAYLGGLSMPEIIRAGVAAGSANARVGGARITRADFESLRDEIAKR